MKIIKTLIVISFCAFHMQLFALNYTISGYIRDAETGEEIIGATISINNAQFGTTSNGYGFYSLTIPKGEHDVSYSFVGYTAIKKSIALKRDTSINITLNKALQQLNELVVSAESKHTEKLDYMHLSIEKIRQLPSIFGEHDVVKALQLQPGIKNIGDGASGLYIRGGNYDQNHVFIDEAPVYNTSHLFGLVSVFNPEMVKDVKVYNSDIPANYGGRLSAVIDTKMKEGNMHKTNLSGGLSILSSRFAIEGPVAKELSSYLLTARRSTYDLLVKPTKDNPLVPRFYDLNAKLNLRVNGKNRIFLSLYKGDDFVKTFEEYNHKWNNTTATLRWSNILGRKLFANTSFIYSNYSNEIIFIDPNNRDGWKTGVEDFLAKSDFNFYLNSSNTIKWGINSTYHKFIPGKSKNEEQSISNIDALEHAIYALHYIKLGANIHLNCGLRYSMFQNIGTATWYTFNDEFVPVKKNIENKGIWNTYNSLEPRIMAKYWLSEGNAIKIAYSRTSQFMQILSNNALSYSSMETWMPSTPNIKPLFSNNFSMGYHRSSNKYAYSIEAYHKFTKNQLDYIGHARLLNNPFIEAETRRGKAKAYGVELAATKTTGRTTAHASYVFSRAFYKIAGINNGEKYRAPYDMPHDVKVQATQKLSAKFKLSAFWTYTSGRPATFPIGYYNGATIAPHQDQRHIEKIPIYSKRNSDKFPDYHRLDLALTFSPPSKKKFRHEASLGLHNVYARRNPLGYDFSFFADNIVQVYHFYNIIPNIAYSFKIN